MIELKLNYLVKNIYKNKITFSSDECYDTHCEDGAYHIFHNIQICMSLKNYVNIPM